MHLGSASDARKLRHGDEALRAQIQAMLAIQFEKKDRRKMELVINSGRADGNAEGGGGKSAAKEDPSAASAAWFGKVAWVSMPRFPWWPGYIVCPESMDGERWALYSRSKVKTKVLVYWFGDKRYAVVPVAKLRPWTYEHSAVLRRGLVPARHKAKKKRKSKGNTKDEV